MKIPSLFYPVFLFLSFLNSVSNLVLAGDSVEKQVTFAAHGHILTNTGAWSADGGWIAYDVRSDPAGDVFDGKRIERVSIETRNVEVLFESPNQAHCGVVTTCPKDGRVVFIQGPEDPTERWQYAAYHRRGIVVDPANPKLGENLDARDLIAPFTVGALRGGTHVHTFSGDGRWVAFTYEDHVLHVADRKSGAGDLNQRNIGISVPVRTVVPPETHPRNHRGSHFSVLVTRTENHPAPGSDEISRAFSDSWVGSDGYVRTSGGRQSKALAFQGHVRTDAGDTISEVFVVDLPDDVTIESETGPLQGSDTKRPHPPRGTKQRRLTYTADRTYPGIQGVRHWLRTSPDGAAIAFLMKNDAGVSQLWTISPNGGEPQLLTNNPQPIGSAFSWSPDGKMIAHTMDGAVCVTMVASGKTVRLAEAGSYPVRPEACVFSPDGSKLAYVRNVLTHGESWNQIFVLEIAMR